MGCDGLQLEMPVSQSTSEQKFIPTFVSDSDTYSMHMHSNMHTSNQLQRTAYIN